MHNISIYQFRIEEYYQEPLCGLSNISSKNKLYNYYKNNKIKFFSLSGDIVLKILLEMSSCLQKHSFLQIGKHI